MADKVYPCPLCGRSANRKGTPFTDPTKTMSHINGAHDARHGDESGNDHLEEIRDNAKELDAAMDDLEESEPGEEPMVHIEALGGEVPVSEAVQSAYELVDTDADSARTEELEELVDQQREQIEELYETIDTMVEQLGASVEFDHRENRGPELQFEKIETDESSTYDPTEEFDE